MKHQTLLNWAVAIAVLIVLGCGGGSSGGSQPSGDLIRASQGGTVRKGSAACTIPPNALSADTRITSSVLTSGFPNAPANRTILGSVYQFGPSGTTFSSPATMTIGYSGNAPNAPKIYTVDHGVWVEVPGSTHDATAKTVSAPVSHFSIFAILSSTGTTGGYELIDLGMLEGDTQSEAMAVSSSGHVVVISQGPGASVRSFLWHGGTTYTVPNLGDLPQTQAHAINGSGTIVGRALAGSGSSARGFRTADGVTHPLVPDTTVPGAGWDINDNGLILASDGGTLYVMNAQGQRTNIMGISSGRDINLQGNIAASDAAMIQLYRNGAVEQLGRPTGSTGAGAHGINDLDHIVGISFEGNNGRWFLWKDGAFYTYAPIGGNTVYAYDINNHGEVVGQSTDPAVNSAQMHAFLWKNGTYINLTTKIPTGSPFKALIKANAINDMGWIVGKGVFENNVEHAFLLRPTG